MKLSELKINSFLENRENKLKIKYFCFCSGAKNPKITLENEEGEEIFKMFKDLKKEGYVRSGK